MLPKKKTSRNSRALIFLDTAGLRAKGSRLFRAPPHRALAAFLSLRLTVMTGRAERLKWAADEQCPVTVMRELVMHDSRRHDHALRFAALTERLGDELGCADVPPDPQAVPLAPWLLPAPLPVMVTLLLLPRWC